MNITVCSIYNNFTNKTSDEPQKYFKHVNVKFYEGQVLKKKDFHIDVQENSLKLMINLKI